MGCSIRKNSHDGYFQSRLNPEIKFNIFNTHYDHRGVEARRKSSQLIVDKMKNYNDYPSFLCGDFNTEPNDEPYHILTKSWVQRWENIN